jgi:hypothetical protein
MRLRRMQHSGTHCVAFFGTRGRQCIRHPRSIIIEDFDCDHSLVTFQLLG